MLKAQLVHIENPFEELMHTASCNRRMWLQLLNWHLFVLTLLFQTPEIFSSWQQTSKRLAKSRTPFWIHTLYGKRLDQADLDSFTSSSLAGVTCIRLEAESLISQL